MSGAGMPTARHGSLTSSLYVAEKESSNEAILAGTAKSKFITDTACLNVEAIAEEREDERRRSTESPTCIGGVAGSRKIPSLIKQKEALYRNMQKPGKNKNMVTSPKGAGKSQKQFTGLD
jgi:hypothetical protein